MSTCAPWRTIGREWFWALSCYSLLIAPFGCQLQSGGLDNVLPSASGETLSTGLFINEDDKDSLLIAGQNSSSDAFFVFGTRAKNGDLEEIESILVQTADGEESYIVFESGRPVHVQGADGSYVHISYEEVSAQRLRANVELYNAATTEKSTYTVEIDLEQTAAQIAALVSEVTGQELEPTTLVSDELAVKDGSQRVRITIFSPWYAAFVLPLIAAVGLMTVVLGQVLLAVYALVAATIQLVLLAVFSPLFLMAEILGDVVFRVELVPLSLIFDLLPPPPIVILV